MNPVTIAGRGFKAHRRVHVRLMVGHTISRRPLANRAGAFTVQFPTVVDRCSGFTVTASQQNRPTVVLQVPPKPACAPAMASVGPARRHHFNVEWLMAGRRAPRK